MRRASCFQQAVLSSITYQVRLASRLLADARTGSFQSLMTGVSCDTSRATVMEYSYTSSLSLRLPVSDELGSHRALCVYLVRAACTEQHWHLLCIRKSCGDWFGRHAASIGICLAKEKRDDFHMNPDLLL